MRSVLLALLVKLSYLSKKGEKKLYIVCQDKNILYYIHRNLHKYRT